MWAAFARWNDAGESEQSLPTMMIPCAPAAIAWSTLAPCLEKSSVVTFHPSSLAAATAPAVGTEHPDACCPQEMTKIFFPFWAGTGSPSGALFVPAYSFASPAFAVATTSADEAAGAVLPLVTAGAGAEEP